MQTDALKLAQNVAANGLAERLTWGEIEFQVTNLDQTIAFWTQALGLQVKSTGEHTVSIGTETKTLFVFHSGATVAVNPRHLGMYHVAIGVSSQAEFSRIFARLVSLGIRVAPVDHLMSKALYIEDPDGLEIEIAFETPERFGRFGDSNQPFIMYDADGQPHNGRSALDNTAELALAQHADLTAPMADDSFLAHMHFKVSDLETAAAWFEGIGFARNLMLPDFGLADLGTGAAYTHRVAMNIWNGRDLKTTPDNMARLTHYTLHAQHADVIPNAKNLAPSDKGLKGIDPSGVPMLLIDG